MNESPSFEPCHAVLTELADLNMRAARLLVRVMEAEAAGVTVAQDCLPVAGVVPAHLDEATSAGLGMDMANAALAGSVPRLETLTRALDRVSRSVRRSVALLRRMQAGWPRAGSDDRAAMVRRQVARGVGEVIARESDGEVAERLFDDLAERLDYLVSESSLLALPVETLVRQICAELGLTAAAMVALPKAGAGPVPEVDSC